MILTSKHPIALSSSTEPFVLAITGCLERKDRILLRYRISQERKEFFLEESLSFISRENGIIDASRVGVSFGATSLLCESSLLNNRKRKTIVATLVLFWSYS